MPWTHNYAALGHSLALTSLAGAIPVFFLFWALAVKRMPGHLAGGVTFLLTFADAVLVYKMPVGLALASGLLGMSNGLFPIAWIVVSAVFLYNLVVEAGQFTIIQSSIASLSDDRRLQALLVAFSFGAFLEGAAGFGTPVAIAGAILIGLGFEPLYAAGICLLANTAPVAFGALGSPIIGVAAVTGLDVMAVSQAVGRQLTLLAVLVPWYLVMIMSGWKAAKEVMPAILVCGISFAVPQYVVANVLGPYLPNIISSLASLMATAVFLRFWKPCAVWRFPNETGVPLQAAGSYSSAQICKAWSPFALLTAMVGIWGLPAFKNWVAHDLQWFVNIPHWPGLDGLVYKVPPIVTQPAVYAASYKLDLVATPGTAMFLTSLMAMLIFRLKPSQGLAVFGKTLRQLRYPLFTIVSVLGFAYLANYSGLSYTLGLLFASAGKVFPLLSPVLGWIGVFLTGSDLSSNALFGKLQQVTAQQIGVNPVLTVAANSSGGVVGKMISPQSIAVAAAATHLVGRESALFRFTFKHSLFFIGLMALVVLVQAYAVPGLIPSAP